MSLDALGRTRDTMVGTEGRKTVRWSKSQKPTPVRIEVCNDLMKPELLVIVGQPYHGEYVLESCTRVAMRSEHLVGESPIVPGYRGMKRNRSVVSARADVKGESSGM